MPVGGTSALPPGVWTFGTAIIQFGQKIINNLVELSPAAMKWLFYVYKCDDTIIELISFNVL